MGEWMLPEISQSVGGIYIMIAGVYIAIVFHDGDSSAFGLENAEGMFLAEGGTQGFLKKLDGDRSDILFCPFIEDRGQEAPESQGRHRGGGHATRGAWLSFHQGQKGEVSGSQRFKETVDFQRIVDIESVDHTEDLGGHPEFLQQAVSMEGSLETAFSTCGLAMEIMYLCGAVETDAHQEMGFGQKPAPLFIE